MVSSSDWIAQAESLRPGGAENRGWLAALALNDEHEARGFCAVSPFDPPAVEIESEPPVSSEPSAPQPVPDISDPVEDDPEERGYLRGFAEGEQLAKRAGEEALLAEQQRYRDLRSAIRKLDEAAQDALAQDLKESVLAMCKQVVGEYAMDEEALVSRCHAAAKRLGAGPDKLTLQLNPDTRAKLAPDAFGEWTLADDPSLAPGALRLTGADGSVRDGPDDWARAFAEALKL